MSRARAAVALGLSTLLVVVVAALSSVSMEAVDADRALLRLSWRAPGIPIEECRTLSEEELAALPAHMRRPHECVGRHADHLLQVEVDGTLSVLDTLRPAGARRDRPLYVLHDLPLEAGNHEVHVSFEPILPSGADAAPDRLAPLRATLELTTGEIVLVTTNENGTAFVVRRPDRGR